MEVGNGSSKLRVIKIDVVAYKAIEGLLMRGWCVGMKDGVERAS
jgi:hypothetical protein